MRKARNLCTKCTEHELSPNPPPLTFVPRSPLATHVLPMSLASILRTRFPSTIPTLSSWTLRPIQRVVGVGIGNFKLLSSPQIRRSGVWLEVIRQVPSEDPNRAGQLTFEDPDLADMRVNRVMRAEGKGVLLCLFIYVGGTHNM